MQEPSQSEDWMLEPLPDALICRLAALLPADRGYQGKKVLNKALKNYFYRL